MNIKLMDVDAIATQFVRSYYTAFDANRAQVAALYVGLGIISVCCLCKFSSTCLYIDRAFGTQF